MKPIALYACLTTTLSLGGCSMLPSAGPTASEVVAQKQAGNEVLFDLVEVDDRVVSTLLAQPKESFYARFGKDDNPPELKIAIGDTISVTIWESGAGGLFSEAPSEQGFAGPRRQTEPLAPEARPQGPEAPQQPSSPFSQFFRGPNLPPGAPIPAPGRPSGTGSQERQTFATEANVATSNRRDAEIPDQSVAPDGAISVPYAGRVPAAGRTPAELQLAIEALLADKALDPQALVIIKKSPANTVTVTGEMVPGARVPLSPAGNRLLEVIAAAGGTARPITANGTTTPTAAGGTTIFAAAGDPTLLAAAGGTTTLAVERAPTPLIHEIFVRLSRNGVTATIPLRRLVDEPAEDIFAQPGDVLTLVRLPQTFSVFGATGRNAAITFDAEKLSVSEALAKSRGLRDDLANPKGVFLFRYELASIVRALDQPLATRAPDGISPVAYRFDLADANTYFLADRFPVRDKDIIFVADAGAVQVQKLFTLFSTVTGPIITGLLVCRSGNTKC